MSNCEFDVTDETKTSAARIMDACETIDNCERKINRSYLEDMLAQIAHLIKAEPEKEAAYALDALNRVYLAEKMRHISPQEARSYLVTFMPAIRKWESDNAQRCALMEIAAIQ